MTNKETKVQKKKIIIFINIIIIIIIVIYHYYYNGVNDNNKNNNNNNNNKNNNSNNNNNYLAGRFLTLPKKVGLVLLVLNLMFVFKRYASKYRKFISVWALISIFL